MFAQITGSATSGLFLSQLFYWHDKGDDPNGWIYKTRDEWRHETYLNRYEQEKARESLKRLGLLEEERRGLPARLYYRLNVERLVEMLNAPFEFAVDEEGNPAPHLATMDMDARSRSHGFVYFLKSALGHYKIGKSKRPNERVGQFTVQLPFPVDVVHVVECEDCHQAERFFHQQFAQQHVNGEWFTLTPADITQVTAAYPTGQVLQKR